MVAPPLVDGSSILATTALVASAGVAAADVTVGGDGRMGVVYDGSDWEFTNRVRVSFTLSGETDTGLAFGGSIRADNAGAGAAGTGGNVFISGEFGRLSLGDVDSADKALVGQLHGVGLTGLGDFNELTYAADGGDANGAAGQLNDLLSGSVNVFAYDMTNAANALLGGFVITGRSGLFEGTGLNQYGFHYNYDTASNPGPDGIDCTTFNAGLQQGCSMLTDAGVRGVVDDLDGIFTTFGVAFDDSVFFDAPTLEQGNPLNAIYTDGPTIDDLFFEGVPAATMAYTFMTALGRAEGDYSEWGDATSDFHQSLPVLTTLTFDTTSPYSMELLFGAKDGPATHDYSLDLDVSVDIDPIPARALYRYDIDGFSIAASYSQLGDSHAYSLAVAYEMDGFSAALGWGQAKYDDAFSLTLSETATPLLTGNAPTLTSVVINESLDVRTRDLSASLGYDMGDIAVKAIYQDKRVSLENNGTLDRHRSIGISGQATFDEVTVSAFAIGKRSRELDVTATSYGLGASYDLGGGASVVGGVARTQEFDFATGTTPSTTRADFGLSFSF